MTQGSYQGEYTGNTIQTYDGGSGGYKYVNVKQTNFDEATGIATVFYYCAFWVDWGDFWGTTMTNYGGWDDQFTVGAADARYGYHEATLHVGWNDSIHFREGCTYYSHGTTKDSKVEFTWYPTTKTYTINYNKNTTESVSGLPSSHTKEYGYSVNISSNELTRTNYNFIGWATSAEKANNLIIDYTPGAQYTTNSNVTLYAVWELAGNYITYDTQGEEPTPSSYFKKVGTTAYITSIIPQKEGYKFKEWNSNSSGIGTAYSAGQGYTDNTDLNLYAIWEKINNKNLKFKNGNRWIPVTAEDFEAVKIDQINNKYQDGMVLAGKEHPNCVWGTDNNGNPQWIVQENNLGIKTWTTIFPTSAQLVRIIKYGKIVSLSIIYNSSFSMGTEMTSMQWSSWTPWKIPEECCPPYNCGLVEANTSGAASQQSNNTAAGCFVVQTDGIVRWHGQAGYSMNGIWFNGMWITNN